MLTFLSNKKNTLYVQTVILERNILKIIRRFVSYNKSTMNTVLYTFLVKPINIICNKRHMMGMYGARGIYATFAVYNCFQRLSNNVTLDKIKKNNPRPFTPREQVFSDVFRANLQNKLYRLDQIQDFKDIFKALILAGKAVDPQFIQKLYYLHNNGIPLTDKLLLVIADLVKHGVS